jgi:hypothetical protein
MRSADRARSAWSVALPDGSGIPQLMGVCCVAGRRQGRDRPVVVEAAEDKPSRPSAVEHRPADVVSQPLIVKDELANRIRELFALPPALEPAGALLAPGRRRTRRLDRVGGSTELVRCDMRHHGRLAGRICGMPSGSAQLSCRTHGMATRRTGLGHPDLAARPCPNLLDCLAGPRIRGLHRLEEVQNVLCARRRPQGQKPVVGVRERPPAADGDEPGIAVLGEDHG